MGSVSGRERVGETLTTSGSKEFHAKSSWRLNTSTEGTVARELASLYQYIIAGTEKNYLLRRHTQGPLKLCCSGGTMNGLG